MKETTPPKNPKKKLWIGYAIVIVLLLLSNFFLLPAMMQAGVKSVNYSTFLQMLEDKELTTVQLEDQEIFFVDKNEQAYKTNAIAQDGDLVNRLEDANVEFGTVYNNPTIWDSLLSLVLSCLPFFVLFWFANRMLTKRMQNMGGANSMFFGGKSAPNSMWWMTRPASSSRTWPVRMKPRRACRRSWISCTTPRNTRKSAPRCPRACCW